MIFGKKNVINPDLRVFSGKGVLRVSIQDRRIIKIIGDNLVRLTSRFKIKIAAKNNRCILLLKISYNFFCLSLPIFRKLMAQVCSCENKFLTILKEKQVRCSFGN